MKYNATGTYVLILIMSIPLLFCLKSFSEGNLEEQLQKASDYISQNQFIEAEKITNELLNSNPDNLNVLKTAILVLYYQDKLDEAEIKLAQIYETNIDLDQKSEYIDFLYLESLIYYEKGERKKALGVLEKLFKINPKHKASYTIYCSIISEMNTPKESKMCLKTLKNMD